MVDKKNIKRSFGPPDQGRPDPYLDSVTVQNNRGYLREKNRRLGNRLLGGNYRRNAFAAGVEIVASGFALKYLVPDFLVSIKESMYHARHAGNTAVEIAAGGPPGKIAAESLEEKLDEAIGLVSQKALHNNKMKDVLNNYLEAKEGYISEVVNLYKVNETYTQQLERLSLQLKGMAKTFFDSGNDLKGGISDLTGGLVDLRAVDRQIILAKGKILQAFGNKEYEGLSDDQIIELEVQKSQNLREFYDNAREFYDAREKNEATVEQALNYIENKIVMLDNEKRVVNDIFKNILGAIRQGYSIEDYLIDVSNNGVDVTHQEIFNVENLIDSYEKQVQETRTEIKKDIPLPKYNDFNWVDVASNPFFMASIAVFAYKGLMNSNPITRQADKALNRGLSYIAEKGLNTLTNLYDVVDGLRKDYLVKKDEEIKR